MSYFVLSTFTVPGVGSTWAIFAPSRLRTQRAPAGFVLTMMSCDGPLMMVAQPLNASAAALTRTIFFIGFPRKRTWPPKPCDQSLVTQLLRVDNACLTALSRRSPHGAPQRPGSYTSGRYSFERRHRTFGSRVAGETGIARGGAARREEDTPRQSRSKERRRR